jgi:hypothetical protein
VAICRRAMPSLLTTAEVARELAMSTDWVREHAAEFGAIRVSGPRSPLRFEVARLEEWKECHRLRFPATPTKGHRCGPRQMPSGVKLVPLPDRRS